MRRYPSSVQPLQPGEFIEFVIHCVSPDQPGSELLPRDGSPFAALHPALLQPKYTANRSCSPGVRAAILE